MPQTTEDTRDLLAAGLKPPARARHTWMGLIGGAAVLLWLFAIIATAMALTKVVLPLLAVGLLIAAGTSTIVACMLSVTVTHWRAMSSDHQAICNEIKDLRVDVGNLAGQVEQLTQQVKTIDPWTIYSMVAADVLGVEVNPGPKP
jgi:hypothetical protein